MRKSFHLNQDKTQQPRCLYVIVYPGMEEQSSLKMKLMKVCDSFNRQRIEYPNSLDQLQRRMGELNQQLQEAKNLIEMTKHQLDQSLDELVQYIQNKIEILYQQFEYRNRDAIALILNIYDYTY